MNSTEVVVPPPPASSFIQPAPTSVIQSPPTQIIVPPQNPLPVQPTIAPAPVTRTPITAPAPSSGPAIPQVAPPVGSATFTFVPGARPTGTSPVNPQGTGVITPNTNVENTSPGLSSSTIVILSCIGAAIVLAGLSIFAFKYFVSRPKKRSEKVELGDAFGKPLSDVFDGGSSTTPQLEEKPSSSQQSSAQYYEKGYYNDQQYYANECANQEEYYQPEYTQQEYLVVNNRQYQQQYEPYYEYQPQVSADGTVLDPFADQEAGYMYPTQTRYETLNQSDPFAPRQ